MRKFTVVLVRKWGGSVGVVIPHRIAKHMKLEPGDEIFIAIERALR